MKISTSLYLHNPNMFRLQKRYILAESAYRVYLFVFLYVTYEFRISTFIE